MSQLVDEPVALSTPLPLRAIPGSTRTLGLPDATPYKTVGLRTLGSAAIAETDDEVPGVNETESIITESP